MPGVPGQRVAGQDCAGTVVCPRGYTAYQRDRAQGCAASTGLLSAPFDNMSMVSQVNHQGGTRSARLLRVCWSLLTWASSRLASLRAVYLPGDRNRVADFLSRWKPPPGEWRLHPEAVESMWGLFGRAEVDLFASEESTHCPLWFSWTEATSPLGQDALAHDWPDRPLYAFPPLPLILPTLQSVLLQGHRLLLVAPFWPGRLWYPLLLRLCCSAPWRPPTGGTSRHS